MLYQMYDFSRVLAMPFRMAAEATQHAFQNPYMPLTFTRLGRSIAAGAEVMERVTRRYAKPKWILEATEFNGEHYPIHIETVMQRPFCHLQHFRREGREGDPKVLIVAPLSGHHATLLRGTVEAMLPEHDVYVTDWVDARLVPLSAGSFDLEDGARRHVRRRPAGADG
jgi:poly(3-hydroxybutyrate) depolymerase